MARVEFTPQEQFSGPKKACGVAGALSKIDAPISLEIPGMQHELHHRGRDSAGMAIFDSATQKLEIYKNIGSVHEVFGGKVVDGRLYTTFDFAEHNLIADRGIGHNRYGTSGDEEKDSCDGAQPMLATWEGRSVAVAFNGNIPEPERQLLRSRIPPEMPEYGNFDTNDIAHAIASAPGETWEEKIKHGMEGVGGAYSLTILADTGEVFGLRGPSGTWPLWVGESSDRIIFGSESVIAQNTGIIGTEVAAGELVKATIDGIERTQLFEPLAEVARCSLHDAYGAKPESQMNGELTYEMFREKLGRRLAKEHPRQTDFYVGVPNSGLQIARGYADELGVELTEVIKAYDTSQRSYNSQNLEAALQIISEKFYIPDPELIRGKSITLIEDSVIKGSTMGGDPDTMRKGIIQHLLNAGASEIHLLTGLAKFVDDCDLGYYIRKDLLAALKREVNAEYRILDEQEIAAKLGADSLGYLSKEGLREVYKEVYNGRETACTKCMGGPHPLHEHRNSNSGSQREVNAVIDNTDAFAKLVTVGV